MKKKRLVAVNSAEPNEDRVVLKPLFGIKPGVYVCALTGFVLLVLLFFLLVFPGLTHNGSVFALNSLPEGAAVYVNEVYTGQTPCETFIPKGRAVITYRAAGFEDWSGNVFSQGRIFGSLFAPKRNVLNAPLAETRPLAALLAGAKDFAAWTFAGEPNAAYQIPLSLSDGVYRSFAAIEMNQTDEKPAGKNAQTTETEENRRADAMKLLQACLRFSSTKAATKDLSRAKFLVDTGGLAPSPFALMASAADTLNRLSRQKGAALWLASLLDTDAASTLVKSAWYTKDAAGDLPAPVGLARAIPLPVSSPLVVGGVSFREAAGAGFAIADSEVTQAEFAAFLKEKPEWADSAALRKAGKAGADYLEGGAPNAGALQAGASWFSAEAFCAWLSQKLPPALAGWEVRLPTEAEWTAAEKDGLVQAGLWDWCDDYFAPNTFFAASDWAISEIGSPERSVRGGALASQNNSVWETARGGLTPDTCSAFVGFRPVIVPKK